MMSSRGWASLRPAPSAWPILATLTLAVAVGAWLRWYQLRIQVLVDDEWHAVHQLLRLSPAQMFVDFGHADYSIPLGLLYGLEARTIGLSETAPASRSITASAWPSVSRNAPWT